MGKISISRSFFETIEELVPAEAVDIALVGDDSINNRLGVLGTNQLGLDGSYSGSAYVFEGPPSISPVQLGVEAGDKIRLSQASGQPVGSNSDRELTVVDPTTLTVFEDLVTPDTVYYKFEVLKRRS